MLHLCDRRRSIGVPSEQSSLSQVGARVVAPVLALLMASALAGSDAGGLDSTRALLEEYHSAKSAAVREPRQTTVLETFRQRRPVRALHRLLELRDEVVLRLGGLGWATVCLVVDSQVLREQVVEVLQDPDPRWRAFACYATRGLSIREAAPLLREMLDDEVPVPSFLGEPPVSLSAAAALASLGYSDGIELLLDEAEQRGGDASAYAPLFRKVSGQDFGDDLTAWRNWFEDEANRSE